MRSSINKESFEVIKKVKLEKDKVDPEVDPEVLRKGFFMFTRKKKLMVLLRT